MCSFTRLSCRSSIWLVRHLPQGLIHIVVSSKTNLDQVYWKSIEKIFKNIESFNIVKKRKRLKKLENIKFFGFLRHYFHTIVTFVQIEIPLKSQIKEFNLSRLEPMFKPIILEYRIQIWSSKYVSLPRCLTTATDI